MPGQHSMLFSSMLQRQLAVGRSVLLPTWTHCQGQQRVQCKWLLAGCQVSTAFISGRAAAHKDSTWQVTVALVYVGPGGHQSQPCLPLQNSSTRHQRSWLTLCLRFGSQATSKTAQRGRVATLKC